MKATNMWQDLSKVACKVDFAEDEYVPIESISKLTGFPVDFIKKELLITEDSISMAELRSSVLCFLQTSLVN